MGSSLRVEEEDLAAAVPVRKLSPFDLLYQCDIKTVLFRLFIGTFETEKSFNLSD